MCTICVYYISAWHFYLWRVLSVIVQGHASCVWWQQGLAVMMAGDVYITLPAAMAVFGVVDCVTNKHGTAVSNTCLMDTSRLVALLCHMDCSSCWPLVLADVCAQLSRDGDTWRNLGTMYQDMEAVRAELGSPYLPHQLDVLPGCRLRLRTSSCNITLLHCLIRARSHNNGCDLHRVY
jgi:hypothetical protein